MENTNTCSSEPQRELTFGEKAVGLTFNPGGHKDVNDVKKAYAGIIDGLNNAIKETIDGEKIRLYKIAITEAQTAQMWAVKAITWNF